MHNVSGNPGAGSGRVLLRNIPQNELIPGIGLFIFMPYFVCVSMLMLLSFSR